jgi:hypothetical protein
MWAFFEFDNMLKPTIELFQGLADTVDALSDAVDVVEDAINSVKKSIDSIWKAIKSIPGLEEPLTSQI